MCALCYLFLFLARSLNLSVGYDVGFVSVVLDLVFFASSSSSYYYYFAAVVELSSYRCVFLSLSFSFLKLFFHHVDYMISLTSFSFIVYAVAEWTKNEKKKTNKMKSCMHWMCVCVCLLFECDVISLVIFQFQCIFFFLVWVEFCAFHTNCWHPFVSLNLSSINECFSKYKHTHTHNTWVNRPFSPSISLWCTSFNSHEKKVLNQHITLQNTKFTRFQIRNIKFPTEEYWFKNRFESIAN